MPNFLSKRDTVLFLYFLIFSFAGKVHAEDVPNLSQVPIFLTSGAEPNVMFILDDSGSMQQEVMPDSLIKNAAYYVFPRVDGVYGASDYESKVAKPYSSTSPPADKPKQSDIYGAIVRSTNNAVYYDPSIRYTPWAHPDGGFYQNSSSTCALHNPRRERVVIGGVTYTSGPNVCRNLVAAVTNQNSFGEAGGVEATRWVNCTGSASCGEMTANTKMSYYPATYWNFLGGDIWNISNYTRHEIHSSNDRYDGHGRNKGKRTDCVYTGNNFSYCTYAQEIQNFANWYTYYRSRVLTARAGVGFAFAKQGEKIRVGFGAINKGESTVDGAEKTKVIISGVRQFTSVQKTKFLTDLYDHKIPEAGTPLLTALEAAGAYYGRKDKDGPWSHSSAVDIKDHYTCRNSNTILMTDGYWSKEDSTSVGNTDLNEGTPFSDGHSNTLADIAMFYWKKDLRPDLTDNLKPNIVDTATWQHMTTYGIGLGVKGILDESYYNVKNLINSKTKVPWPDPRVGTGEAKVDDLLHASVNGRGDFFSAKDPDVFAEQLGAVLKDIDERAANSASAAAANSTSLNDNSVIYQALFNSEDWSGDLKARRISSAGVVSDDVLWNASIPAPAERNIYTYNGGKVKFLWGNLSSPQKAILNGKDGYGQDRLDWIRGIQPTNSAMGFRSRTKLLGDIVNSDPVFAGNNNSNFDRINMAGSNSYADYYKNVKKVRREMIYVGANDGMLHAFNANTDIGSGTPGVEALAYIPTAVFGKFIGLSSNLYGKKGSSYQHTYSVDGPINISDAYIGGQWRNILVGTLGAGGRGIYVLDITDPYPLSSKSTPQFEVLFELTEAKYPELGKILGSPIIAPGKDGRWKIYIGNGYNSSDNDKSKAFLGIIDIEDEYNNRNNADKSSNTRFIAAGATENNGLAQPALLPDFSTDGTISAAYAGDLFGNLWKFDLSDTSPANWKLSYGSPLFIAQAALGKGQPITSSPTLGMNTLTKPATVMVYFGTGQYLLETDQNPGTDVQTFYAIADKKKAITATNRSTLHQKILNAELKKVGTVNVRVIDKETKISNGTKVNAVDWPNVDGWYLDFPGGERIITKSLLLNDRLIFPTFLPSSSPCGSGGSSWLMELIATGSIDPEYSVLKVSNTLLPSGVVSNPTSIQGSFTAPKENTNPLPGDSPTSSSSSSVPSDCGTGTIAVVTSGTESKINSNLGKKYCDLYKRQSWRELR